MKKTAAYILFSLVVLMIFIVSRSFAAVPDTIYAKYFSPVLAQLETAKIEEVKIEKPQTQYRYVFEVGVLVDDKMRMGRLYQDIYQGRFYVYVLSPQEELELRNRVR